MYKCKGLYNSSAFLRNPILPDFIGGEKSSFIGKQLGVKWGDKYLRDCSPNRNSFIEYQ